MSRWGRFLLAATVAAGTWVAAVSVYDARVHDPALKALDRAEDRLDSLQRTLEKASAAARYFKDSLPAEMEQMEAESARLERAVPPDLDVKGWSDSLVETTRRLGWEGVEAELSEPECTEFYRVQQISFWVEEPTLEDISELIHVIEDELPLRCVRGLWVGLESGRPTEAKITVSFFAQPPKGGCD